MFGALIVGGTVLLLVVALVAAARAYDHVQAEMAARRSWERLMRDPRWARVAEEFRSVAAGVGGSFAEAMAAFTHTAEEAGRSIGAFGRAWDEWYRSLSWWQRLRWRGLDGRRG